MRRQLAALFVSVTAAFPAQAFLASNDLKVEPAAGGAFHVPYPGLSGARDFWCAAGDYVVRELGLPPDTRIYRTSSPPRRAGEGITFSLSPENARRPGLVHFGPGMGLTAAHARQFCETDRFLLDLD